MRAQVVAERTLDGVHLRDDERSILFYRTRAADASLEPSRVHYVHPLFAPDGTILTEDRPTDHIHHRGVFWAWRRILLDGRVLADSWGMRDLTYRLVEPQFEARDDGGGTLRIGTNWLATSHAREQLLFTERSSIGVSPLQSDGARSIAFDVSLASRIEGVSIAGSDDVKGYGGFSLRLVRPERLMFESSGQPIQPSESRVTTDGEVRFGWDDARDLPRWTIRAWSTAQGVPVTDWILRRNASMQNAMFPGRSPLDIPVGMPLRLAAALLIEPR